jgi:2-C-methyl-D-erythritol 4-phosphate cytidylyltransferase / 2-C-methyl-D-erythritol 2,4-cyclodiphosphate synthase
MSVAAIIVAAGRGTRLGSGTPKQFLSLGVRSVLQRSVEAFDRHPQVSEIVVVLPAEEVASGAALVGPTTRRCVVVAGGERRQDSVKHGVAALGPNVERVLVHDAARPFVTTSVIDRVLEAIGEHGAVVPAIAVRDTVKRVPRESTVVAATLPRDEIWLAQTPQGFRRALLTSLVNGAAAGADATDEATLAERAGHSVRVVAGDEANVKITTADDLTAARARVEAVIRVGTGYDLHRLAEGRPLVLAGVTLASDRGPVAHSDGDVLAHALIDAILGAAGAGDIGRHFPNTDPAWKNASGLDLLARTMAIVRAAGWTVAQADATVVLERPRLASRIDAMRTALAQVLDITPARVSVKAKTNEGVDAVGRGEAIAAHAIAVLTPLPPSGS